MNRWISIAVTGLLIAFSAAAADTATPVADKKQPPPAFSKMDKDGDGKLSLSEFLGKNRRNEQQKTARFRKLDSNNDGYLTPAEFSAPKVSNRGNRSTSPRTPRPGKRVRVR